MAQWLTDEYGRRHPKWRRYLAQPRNTGRAEVADRNAGIVLKINKERLKRGRRGEIDSFDGKKAFRPQEAHRVFFLMLRALQYISVAMNSVPKT
jgi:hypothetical protein